MSTHPSPPPPDLSPIRLLVLISGSGTNLQALIDACHSHSSSPPALPATIITHVISNRKAAYGLVRAAHAGIPTTYHNLVGYRKRHGGGSDDAAAVARARAEYDADLAALVLGAGDGAAPRPHLVVCAGWMHVLSPAFLAPLAAAGVAVVNLHPALPGRFNGVDAIRRAWEAYNYNATGGVGPKGLDGLGERTTRATGVMVHHVVAEVDMGSPVVVEEVEFREGEGLEEFEARVHEVEWRVIVEGVRRVSEEVRRGRREGGDRD